MKILICSICVLCFMLSAKILIYDRDFLRVDGNNPLLEFYKYQKNRIWTRHKYHTVVVYSIFYVVCMENIIILIYDSVKDCPLLFHILHSEKNYFFPSKLIFTRQHNEIPNFVFYGKYP